MSRSVFPIGLMTCVTGVSGSGKSTLVNDVLCRALFRHFYHSKEAPGENMTGIDGLELIDKAIVIDQTPIGRTPRSNPLTYTGAFNTDPRSLRAVALVARARVWAGPVQLQREGRTLRALRGRRRAQNRNEFSAAGLRHVRGRAADAGSIARRSRSLTRGSTSPTCSP